MKRIMNLKNNSQEFLRMCTCSSHTHLHVTCVPVNAEQFVCLHVEDEEKQFLTQSVDWSYFDKQLFFCWVLARWGLAQCLGVASSRQTKDGVIGKEDCRYLRLVLCCVLPSAATNSLSLLVARKYDAHPPPLLAILLVVFRLRRFVCAGGVKNIHLLLAGIQVEVTLASWKLAAVLWMTDRKLHTNVFL